MILRNDTLARRLAASGFCLTVLFGLLGALALMALTTAPPGKAMPTVDDVATKYSAAKLTAAMKTSMYDYVSDDDDIVRTEQWIAEGRSEAGYTEVVKPLMENDCVKCHNPSSTMSNAAPHMPLTTYQEVLVFTERGHSWRHLTATLHTHLFGIGLLMLVTSLLFSFAGLKCWVTSTLISAGFVGLWMDVGGWVLAKFSTSAAVAIYLGGGLAAGSLAAMAGLTLLSIWIKLPVLADKD